MERLERLEELKDSRNQNAQVNPETLLLLNEQYSKNLKSLQEEEDDRQAEKIIKLQRERYLIDDYENDSDEVDDKFQPKHEQNQNPPDEDVPIAPKTNIMGDSIEIVLHKKSANPTKPLVNKAKHLAKFIKIKKPIDIVKAEPITNTNTPLSLVSYGDDDDDEV